MSEGRPDSSAAQQVELAVSGIEGLSILPCVIAQFLSRLNSFELTPGSLAELVEADPALTIAVLSTCSKQSIAAAAADGPVRSAIDQVPLRQIRDSLISARLYGGADAGRIEFRKAITRHCIAVACCAKQIADLLSSGMNADMVYLAGLLHDVGKLALDEAMPKSFDRIVEEAKSTNAPSRTVEQKYLSVDHTILGKRLAQKLHLPAEVILAIWLHHSNTQAVSQAMPEARIAQIIELADSIARLAKLGESGSYDSPPSPDELGRALGLTTEQLEQVRAGLAEVVDHKANLIGLDLANPQTVYCDAIKTTAAQLAQDAGKLLKENQQLQADASHFNFVNELLQSIGSAVSPAGVVESVTLCWQRAFQTGPVCLYLAPSAPAEPTAAFVLETAEEKTLTYVKVPEDAALVPQGQSGEFTIFDAEDRIEWLFEQIDVKFDLSRTKLAPLSVDGRAVGAIVFEPGYPASAEQLAERLKPAATLAAIILDSALGLQRQQWFAERFAQLLTTPTAKLEQPKLDEAAILDALAEMAAGAAHELNNPLSVISGRAQLLAQSETDAEKKRILQQIQQNAGELSAIIEDLMSYANPPQPRPVSTPLKQILEEAVELTSQEQQTAKKDIQLEIAPDLRGVLVDSAQVASTIANILSNSLESYQGGTGPVKVVAANDESGESVRITITDTGCGMDAETLRRAAQPFFSARDAGRKRGMGLAHAQRLIQINGGSLNIASRPGKGTSVTVLLPVQR